MSLWDTLDLPWQTCLEEAWAASCAGTVPIGAVVIDAAGCILSRGRNRILDQGEPPYVYGHTLAHAELNALVALDYNGVDPHTCAIYTTTEPCPLCMGAIYMSGVRQVHYASRDPYAGSTNILGTTPYLSRKPVKVFGPERLDLEIAVMAMFVEFELHRHADALDGVVIRAWQAGAPEAAIQAVRIGESLFRSGELVNLQDVDGKAKPYQIRQFLKLVERYNLQLGDKK